MYIQFLGCCQIQGTLRLVVVFKLKGSFFACSIICDYRLFYCQFSTGILHIDHYFINLIAISIGRIIRNFDLTYIVNEILSLRNIFYVFDIILIIVQRREFKFSIGITCYDHVLTSGILYQVFALRICRQLKGELLRIQCTVTGQSLGSLKLSRTSCLIAILKGYLFLRNCLTGFIGINRRCYK